MTAPVPSSEQSANRRLPDARRGYIERWQAAQRDRCTCEDGKREPWQQHDADCSLWNTGWAT